MSSSTPGQQRYRILVKISVANIENQPTVLVPLDPQSLIRNFVDDIWRRLARFPTFQAITPDTHTLTLHFNSFDGPLIDIEDLVADVIHDCQNETICIVVTKKGEARAADGETNFELIDYKITPIPAQYSNGLRVRIVQPSNLRDRENCISFPVSQSDTIQDLHKTIASKLGMTIPAEHTNSNECNCVYGRKIAQGPSNVGSFVVIHGKSIVDRLPLHEATLIGMQRALDRKFGPLLLNKKVTIEPPVPSRQTNAFGASMNAMPVTFERTPIAIICSKERHVPAHARVDPAPPYPGIRRQALDLHTSELHIHPNSYGLSIQEAGLAALAVDNVIDIFVVQRNTQGAVATLNNKSGIFAHQTHWEPITSQTPRGLAMFLSSLRVFTSLFHEDSQIELALDAMLRVFDHLAPFPPALRCLAILCHGRTPTAPECSALSQAMYIAMSRHCSGTHAVLKGDIGRIFEGSRLFFGFLLESARSLKAVVDGDAKTPFTFRSVDLRDFQTMEPVSVPIQTSEGLVEQNLFQAFHQGGALADGHLQSFMTKLDIDPELVRTALLSGGVNPDIMVMSIDNRMQHVEVPLEMIQLDDLDHLAELCGRNKLAVHKPGQLASAISPCLTFDRTAHLAVYTGEQPCGEAGRSSMIFRPLSGTEETIDPTLVEQIIAPILRQYRIDGTAVFDLLGGAELKRLQDPTEILMFCVDASSSMKQRTDFVVLMRSYRSLPSQVLRIRYAICFLPYFPYHWMARKACFWLTRDIMR